jgi:cell division ATPase FtsA
LTQALHEQSNARAHSLCDACAAGVDQAGLGEVLGLVFQRLPKHIGDAVAAGGVVLTGGNACFAGGQQSLCGWVWGGGGVLFCQRLA